MKRWKHMDGLISALRNRDYLETRINFASGRRYAMARVRRGHGRHGFWWFYRDEVHPTARMMVVNVPQSFREWQVNRYAEGWKPFNYCITEGDKRVLERAGFIDLPEHCLPEEVGGRNRPDWEAAEQRL